MALTLKEHQTRTRSWFLTAIDRGIGVTRLVTMLQGAGLGFRMTNMFRFYHELEGFVAQFPTIQKMYYDRPIPIVRHWEAGLRQSRTAVYRTETTAYDALTGETVTLGYTVAADQAMSWEDIRGGAETLFYRYNLPEDFQILDVRLKDARLRR